jgi:hypothetical protein
MEGAQQDTGVGVIGERARRFETACGGSLAKGGGGGGGGGSRLILDGLECFVRKASLSSLLYIHESRENKKVNQLQTWPALR